MKLNKPLLSLDKDRRKKHRNKHVAHIFWYILLGTFREVPEKVSQRTGPWRSVINLLHLVKPERGNIYHQYTPNVSIYTIHGSYGYHPSNGHMGLSESWLVPKTPALPSFSAWNCWGIAYFQTHPYLGGKSKQWRHDFARTQSGNFDSSGSSVDFFQENWKDVPPRYTVLFILAKHYINGHFRNRLIGGT